MDENEREDGELSDNELVDNIYNPMERPIHPDAILYRNNAKSIISSDEDDSSDSDIASLPKRKKTHAQMEFERNGSLEAGSSNAVRKRNNIWANVLEEEQLTQVIGGVGLKKLNTDRNVESYDYTQALKEHRGKVQESDEEGGEFLIEDEQTETLEEVHKRMTRKRKLHNRLSHKSKNNKTFQSTDGSVRNLIEIELYPNITDEELGCAIAEALFESKPELIVKVVEVLGHEKALKLYNETRKLEKEGGMMILNGGRRRTSGGVYLQLLKKFDGVEKSHLTQIFSEDVNSTSQWRKRKRMIRRRRHDSKNQVVSKDSMEEDGLHLKGLFSDDPGGTKCPGSTPVTTPQGSDVDEEETNSSPNVVNGSQSLHLKEVCEKAAFEISTRDQESKDEESSHSLQDDMDVF